MTNSKNLGVKRAECKREWQRIPPLFSARKLTFFANRLCVCYGLIDRASVSRPVPIASESYVVFGGCEPVGSVWEGGRWEGSHKTK